MALPIHIAMVSEGVDVDPSEMTKVAAALSKQVEHDFSKIWNVDATVDAFVSLDDVPIDYWQIILMREVKGAAGYHQDDNGQPFAVVEFHDQWSITASHELLEMLADPFGRRMKSGSLLDQALHLGLPSKKVKYLVEVCDPSESGQFSYQVNSIQVSDFYTPQFFDPVAAPGVRYSFTGAIDAPRKIMNDGYISWQDLESGHFFQLRMFPDEFSDKVPHILDLTKETEFERFKNTDGLRGASDRVTKPPKYHIGLHGSALVAAKAVTESASKSQVARAAELRKKLKELIDNSAKPSDN